AEAEAQARDARRRPGRQPPARLIEVALSALGLTASDGAAFGTRVDEWGAQLEERLRGLGFGVERVVVEDDEEAIGAAIVAGVARHPLVVTTGGSGLRRGEGTR